MRTDMHKDRHDEANSCFSQCLRRAPKMQNRVKKSSTVFAKCNDLSHTTQTIMFK